MYITILSHTNIMIDDIDVAYLFKSEFWISLKPITSPDTCDRYDRNYK